MVQSKTKNRVKQLFLNNNNSHHRKVIKKKRLVYISISIIIEQKHKNNVIDNKLTIETRHIVTDILGKTVTFISLPDGRHESQKNSNLDKDISTPL